SEDAADSGEASGEQVFNMIETAEIPTGDPSLATDAASFIVFGQTMEGLYILDENDTPVPAIADGEPVKSWFTSLSNKIAAYIDHNIDSFKDEGRYVYEIIHNTHEDRTFFLSSS